MQGKQIVFIVYAVLTMEDFLEGKLLILINRKERTVDVRILLIAMDDEGDDVFLSIFICHKAIDVLCPLFYFGHSPDMLVATLAFKIYLLIAKGKFTHTFRRTAKDEIHHGSETWLCQSLIGVFDAT